MIEELGIVEPSMPFGPIYRVTGDWERLVESRQALEYGKAVSFALLFILIIPPSRGSSDFVEALNFLALLLLLVLVRAALDAIWVARHAAELELVDRASSGLDEWRKNQARQRSAVAILLRALLLGGGGAWMLWVATRPDSWMNPWIFVPMALLLISHPIEDVYGKLRSREPVAP